MHTQDLLNALKQLRPVFDAPQSRSYPVLNNVLLDATGDCLTLTGCNLSSFITAQLPYTGEPFRLTAPFQLLYRWFDTVAESCESVSLSVVKGMLQIASDTFSYQFGGMDASEFPALPVLEDGSVYTLDRASLVASLKAAAKFVRRDDRIFTQSVLTGIQFRVSDGAATIAATDNFVAMQQAIGVEGPDCNIVIRHDLVKLLEKSSAQTVTLQVGQEAIGVTADELHFTSRLIEGTFPDMTRVFAAQDWHVAVDRKPLRKVLERLTQKGTAADRDCERVWIETGINELIITGANGVEHLAAQVRQPGLLCCNAWQLIEVLKVSTTHEVTLTLTDSVCIVKPLGNSAVYAVSTILAEKPANPLSLQQYTAILETSSNHEQPTMITITTNYFADLNTAIAAGIFPANSKPKKAALYAAIEAHNAVEPIAAETQTEPTGDDLLAMDAIADAQPKVSKPKRQSKAVKPKPENYGKSGKSLDKNEVWSADRIRAVKKDSQMGKVLEYMFVNQGIGAMVAEDLALTRAQFTQAIGSISEAGYGIAKENDTYRVILPAELTAPKLK